MRSICILLVTNFTWYIQVDVSSYLCVYWYNNSLSMVSWRMYAFVSTCGWESVLVLLGRKCQVVLWVLRASKFAVVHSWVFLHLAEWSVAKHCCFVVFCKCD